jgi:hypothetical protein
MLNASNQLGKSLSLQVNSALIGGLERGGAAMAILFGDTDGTLSGHQKGKHQDLVGTANGDNLLFGDAGESIAEFARGGNDNLTGGNNSDSGSVFNQLIGDAGGSIAEFARGGNDKLTGGDNSDSGSVTNTLIGDAAVEGFLR